MDCKRLTLSLIALASLAPSPRLAAAAASAALSLMEVLFDLHGSNAVSPAPANVRRRALLCQRRTLSLGFLRSLRPNRMRPLYFLPNMSFDLGVRRRERAIARVAASNGKFSLWRRCGRE